MNRWVLVATLSMLFPDNALGRDIPPRKDLGSEFSTLDVQSRKASSVVLATVHVPGSKDRDGKSHDSTHTQMLSWKDPNRYTRPDEPNASQQTQKERGGLMQFVVIALALTLLIGGFYWMKKKRSLRN